MVIQKAEGHQLNSENGQGMVEYGLIIAVIVIAVFIVMAAGFAPKVFGIFESIRTQVSNVG